MLCPRCGRENPDEARICGACNSPLTPATTGRNVEARTSRLAILSLVLAVLPPLTWPLAIAMRAEIIVQAGLILVFAALIVGIVGLVRIETSGGRLVGRGFAIVGITIPTVLLCLIFLPRIFLRPRSYAHRMVCGSNLAGIGKAMLIYANDYDDKLPRAGGPGTIWQPEINNWQAGDRFAAYNLHADGTGGAASISASFYLLVKYVELKPKSFVCDKDRGTKEFKPADYGVRDKELIDFWDFGPEPWKHCSYAYHMPYGPYALTTAGEAGLAVAADRSPWIRTHKLKARDFSVFKPDGELKEQKTGNSPVHKGDGQNVLFLDSHVYFEKRAYCAIDDDNIYTFWDAGDIRRGRPPVVGSQPQDKLDSLLVHDLPVADRK
jgi:hypothetical protein